LELLEDGLMLGLVVPGQGEGVGVAVDGVGYGDGLMEVGGNSFEGREFGLGHGAGGFAAMEIGAVGVVVEVAYEGDGVAVGGDVLGVFNGAVFKGGTISVVGGS
jgi:hypothetical protein